MTHLEDTPASPKTALAPDLRRMDERSARAWTERMAVRPLGRGRYAVDSQSGATYVVDLPEGTCTCPDHAIRGARCKHVRRVAIEINAGRVPAPGKRRGECAACRREGFVPEKGPPLCRNCHLERGDVVRDRETGDLAVVARVTDRRAREVEAGDTGTTVADYETNRAYPDDDLVVEVVYPFSAPGRGFEELRHYSFPITRLERQDQQLL